MAAVPAKAAAKKRKPRKKRPAKKHVAGSGARMIANLCILAVFGAGCFVSYLQMKPMVRLEKAWDLAMNPMKPETAKPGLVNKISDKIEGIMWGDSVLAKGTDAINALDSVIDDKEVSRQFKAAVAAAGVASLLEKSKLTEAAKLAQWAAAQGLADEQINEQEYEIHLQQIKKAMKDRDIAGAKVRIADALQQLAGDPDYPTPGRRAACVAEMNLLSLYARARQAIVLLKSNNPAGAADELAGLDVSEVALPPSDRETLANLKSKVRDALKAQADAVRAAGDSKQAEVLTAKAAALEP